MLFQHIVKNSAGVSIGPLEYCGNGRVFQTTTGMKRYVYSSSTWYVLHLINYSSVSIVRGVDPGLKETDLRKALARPFKKKAGIDQPGKRKGKMTPQQCAGLEKALESISSVLQKRKFSSMTSASSTIPSSSPPPSSPPLPSSPVLDDLDLDMPQLTIPPLLLDSLNIAPPPRKKRRIYADHHITREGLENIELSSHQCRTTRSKVEK